MNRNYASIWLFTYFCKKTHPSWWPLYSSQLFFHLEPNCVALPALETTLRHIYQTNNYPRNLISMMTPLWHNVKSCPLNGP